MIPGAGHALEMLLRLLSLMLFPYVARVQAWSGLFFFLFIYPLESTFPTYPHPVDNSQLMHNLCTVTIRT